MAARQRCSQPKSIKPMKATIEFNLTDPDDRHEFVSHTKTPLMRSALFELTHNFRRRIDEEVLGDPDMVIDSFSCGVDYAIEVMNIILEDENLSHEDFE
jgi:hypothetical protein